MSGTFDFTIGNDKKARTEKRRFSGDKGFTYRVSFAWYGDEYLNDDGLIDWDKVDGGATAKSPEGASPLFKGTQRSYVKGKGYFINPGTKEYIDLLGPPKKVCGTIIVQWPTTKDGEIIGQSLEEGDFDVLYWTFPPKKYEAFAPFHLEFGYSSHDLKISCTNSDFQHLDFSLKKGCLLRKVATSDKPAFQKMYREIMNKVAMRAEGMTAEFGRDLSPSDIRKVLAGQSVTNVSVNTVDAGDVDDAIDDVLDV